MRAAHAGAAGQLTAAPPARSMAPLQAVAETDRECRGADSTAGGDRAHGGGVTPLCTPP